MYKINTTCQQFLGDTLTPVSMYLAIREKFGQALLLESSDYHGNEHTYSYICFCPYAGFVIDNTNNIHYTFPDKSENAVVDVLNYPQKIEFFLNQFEYEKLDSPCIYNGLFGFSSYNAIQYFEDIPLKNIEESLPAMRYHLYQYILAFNHFNQQITIFRHEVEEKITPKIEEILNCITEKITPKPFQVSEVKTSNHTDESYLEQVKKGISHCIRGDVFQIVVSRKFSRQYNGDEFQIYRALRSINPSPYLFYFDYDEYQFIGSSPEAQLIIKGDKVTIHPIAGTFRRSGNDQQDAVLAQQLSNDQKENAEHVMLVDLARNDLSRTGHDVQVEVFKEVQYYSHVIHLVSKVTATVSQKLSKIKMVGDTFPAGTLSGAPKYRALQLIDEIEPTPRGNYGGALGYLGFDGNFNHAIMIRTFWAKNGVLHYQAGAGIVADSQPSSELQEVENKLMALNIALEMAQKL